MNNSLCKLVGCDFPLFAFSHCRDVVAAVSRAGGFGVLGGISFTPEQLKMELRWIDDHVDGKPYGIDILVPEHMAVDPSHFTAQELAAQVPARHLAFTRQLLASHGIEARAEELVDAGDNPLLMNPRTGEELMDVAFSHPIRLIANALGIAPRSMIDRARKHGVPVGALVGAKEHALRQVQAGVDFIVAQGTEAGGHCGEVSTLVLVPEVVRAIGRVRPVPVLAAGGIMTGRQMAGAMALGAQGVWTGSVWLATSEAETSEALRDKLIAASSRDTVRSVYRTGKPLRQLNSAWFRAWEGQDSPGPLPFPMMGAISVPAFAKVEKSCAAGNTQARELVSYPVGQGVGLIEGIRSTASVVAEFRNGFADAVLELTALAED